MNSRHLRRSSVTKDGRRRIGGDALTNWRLKFIELDQLNDQPLPFLACDHPRTERRRKNNSKGFHVGNQCLRCGQLAGTWQKRSFGDAALNLWDDSIYESHVQERQEGWESRRLDRRHRWNELYREYLGSCEWNEIRKEILDRDNFTCQGCLINFYNAEGLHVHHKTYSHVGAELFFQLVTLCEECHERAHS